MSSRVLIWTALALVGIVLAVLIDLFLFPAPRSSHRIETAGDRRLSVEPPLREGSPFPEKIEVLDSKHSSSLSFTGSYARSRKLLFTVDVYEVASYVERLPTGTVDEMLESIWRHDGRKAYLLRFLFPLPGWQLRQAVRDEMARSFQDVSLDDHREELDQLLAGFGSGASVGDVFYLVRVPGNRIFLGVRSAKNLSLISESPELTRAIWRMWAGPTAEPGRAGLVKSLAPTD